MLTPLQAILHGIPCIPVDGAKTLKHRFNGRQYFIYITEPWLEGGEEQFRIFLVTEPPRGNPLLWFSQWLESVRALYPQLEIGLKIRVDIDLFE